MLKVKTGIDYFLLTVATLVSLQTGGQAVVHSAVQTLDCCAFHGELMLPFRL